MEKKMNKRRNLRKVIILTMAGIAVSVSAVVVVALNKGNADERYVQSADYMYGETEASESVNATHKGYSDNDVTEVTYTSEQTEVEAEDLTESTIGNIVEEKTKRTAVKETKTKKQSSYNRLDVKCILQNPELPTGCEITALTIVLNYLGYDVDKLTLADDFLDKGEVGSTSPYKAFVGNPRDEDACGAFAPVIANSARRYLDSRDSDMNVYNVTGADYNELVGYVDDGHPVLVWETMWMAKPHEAAVWEVDGESITWLSHEHVMVLIGYTEDTYIMADPLRGIYEYDKLTVESRYKDMGRQAIVIY